MLQSRSSSLRRTVGLLITCHHLIMCWLHLLLLQSFPLLHSLLLHEWTLDVPPLSLPKVLATSFAMPKAMISLFVTNYKNSCKSKTKLLFLGQLLCVPQIYWFLQVFGFLTYYSWYWGNSSIGFIPDFHCPFDTLGKHSWFFYTTCCNHMNLDES